MVNVKIKKSTYENVYADCPFCKKENVYNRRSDLKDTTFIDGKNVKCSFCNKKYHIYNDLVQEAYRYLLDYCQDFMEQKQYMYSIISLCIACESFMSYAIYQVLLNMPFNNNSIDINEHNDLALKLFKKLKNFAFDDMRKLFFDIFLNDKIFENKSDISNYIAAIKITNLKTPTNKTINRYPDNKLKNFFLKLKNLKINEIRNKVVHGIAYRPTLDEAIKHKEEVEDVIIGLSVRLWEKYRWNRFSI